MTRRQGSKGPSMACADVASELERVWSFSRDRRQAMNIVRVAMWQKGKFGARGTSAEDYRYV